MANITGDTRSFPEALQPTCLVRLVLSMRLVAYMSYDRLQALAAQGRMPPARSGKPQGWLCVYTYCGINMGTMYSKATNSVATQWLHSNQASTGAALTAASGNELMTDSSCAHDACLAGKCSKVRTTASLPLTES